MTASVQQFYRVTSLRNGAQPHARKKVYVDNDRSIEMAKQQFYQTWVVHMTLAANPHQFICNEIVQYLDRVPYLIGNKDV